MQENYIKSYQAKRTDKDQDTLSAAAAALSDCDLVEKKIGAEQNWSMLPLQGTLTCRVGSIIKNSGGFPDFPSWLGKNSSAGKKRRLIKVAPCVRAAPFATHHPLTSLLASPLPGIVGAPR